MENKKENTGLSVAKQYTQADIPSLLEQVNKQIKELKGNRDKIVRINDSLGNFGKISDIKDAQTLRGAYAYITRKLEAIDSFKEVFEEIDSSTKVEAAKESGHSLTQWQEEIKAQYNEISYSTKLDKLQKVKDELEKNLSAEMKLAASLANITDILGLNA